MSTPHTPFKCPLCGGSHFGSKIETRDDGSLWKVAEECHDEHRVGCKCVVHITPVMLIGPKKDSEKP